MTENSLVERLEPCPFCGKSAQGAIYSCARISVYCECGARGPSFGANGSTDAASADYRDALVASEQAWNRRASATTIAELRGQVERLRAGLDEICHPIVAMRRRAEAEGAKLDGHMAVALANDPHYLAGIARATLEGRSND